MILNKKVIIVLDNGLGNKLLTLLHGLYVCTKFNINPYLIYSIRSEHETKYIYNLNLFINDKIEYINKEDDMKLLKNIHSNTPKNNFFYVNKRNFNIFLNNAYLKITEEYIIIAHITTIELIPHIKDYVQEKYYNIFKYKVKYIFSQKYEYIGIHIRTGDFIYFNLLTQSKFYILKPEYYIKYIELILENNKNTNFKILLFTNDIEKFLDYITNNLKKYKNIISFEIISNDPIEDIVTLSKCKYLILSRSSFSSWALLLNRNGVAFLSKDDTKIEDQYTKNIMTQYKDYIMLSSEIKKYFPIQYKKYSSKDYEKHYFKIKSKIHKNKYVVGIN